MVARTDTPQGGEGEGGPGDDIQGETSGSAQPQQGAERGEGGGGQPEPATTMDRIVRVAGWWHLEFSASPGGQSGGIPGGMSRFNFGAWGQAAFLALTVADIALTVLSLGRLAAIKTAASTALRVSMRTLADVARRSLTSIRRLPG